MSNSVDLLPRDVLALLLSKALKTVPEKTMEKLPPHERPVLRPPPQFGTNDELQKLQAARQNAAGVWKEWQNYALVCKSMNRACQKDVVVRAMLQNAHFFVPRVLWANGSLKDAFRIQYAQLGDQIHHQKEQDVTKSQPIPMVACGMRAPPGQGLGSRPEVGLEQSYHLFVGLNEKEQKRIVNRAVTLLDFLRSFDLFASTFNAESSLQRYRMFLKLQLEYPNTLLIPSADILFVMLSHVLRTKKYHDDLKSLSLSTPDPLCLAEEEERFYNEAVAATASLWQKTFGESYPAYVPHQYFKHQTDIPYFTSANSAAEYVRPPSYVASVFASATTPVINDLPRISLSVKDVMLDLKWIPQMQKEFQELSSRAYFTMANMYNATQESVCWRLLESYQRFLFLCKTRPELGSELAPPVAIDLLWHAHQSTPVLYEAETTRIVGFRVDHEPWPAGDDLRNVSEKMACAWKTAFGTELQSDHLFSPSGSGGRVGVKKAM